jgi:hypothetical protein
VPRVRPQGGCAECGRWLLVAGQQQVWYECKREERPYTLRADTSNQCKFTNANVCFDLHLYFYSLP